MSHKMTFVQSGLRADDEEVRIAYQYPHVTNATYLEVKVVVDPDHWYRRFYENMLANGRAGKGKDAIRQAYTTAVNSVYTLYQKRFAL